MRLLKLAIKGLPHFHDTLDIDFVTNQRIESDDKEWLYHVFSNIYTNEAIAFIGINASGKTTILKAISFAMKMLNNEAINSIESKVILNDLSSDERVAITTYFFDGRMVNKLETYIKKRINAVDRNEKFFISDERLWSKEKTRIKTKKSMFDFADSDLQIKRDQDEQYLLDDVSIMVAVNKKANGGFPVLDMLEWTDHNMLHVLGQFPKELLAFLDSSIEYLDCSYEEKKLDIRLKFYGKEEVIINRISQLENYLSSGTIKGLGIFMSAWLTFNEGGYLIIDEIENHFNREIVVTLIRFFMEQKVNRSGATLIFSTHYSELLDQFQRNDGIYIVRNRGGITAENLSDVLKRNDLKKSEIYDSDYLGGTVPAYDAYMALKKVLISGRIKKGGA